MDNKARMQSILRTAMAHTKAPDDFPFYNATEFKRQLAAVDPPTPWSIERMASS